MLFRKKHKAASFAVTVPEPCRENWNKMHPADGVHRYCGSCAKNVVDFTNMSDDELLLYFRHSNQQICGRFRKDQVNRPMTLIPETTRPSSWWKAAMLLPLTLFAKSVPAQQNDSLTGADSLTVQSDSLVSVADTVAVDSVLVQSDSAPGKSDSLTVMTKLEAAPTTVCFIAGDPDFSDFVLGWCPMPYPVSIPENPSARLADTFSVDTTEKIVSKPEQTVYETTSPLYSDHPPSEPKDAPVPPPVPARPWYDAIIPERIRIRRV